MSCPIGFSTMTRVKGPDAGSVTRPAARRFSTQVSIRLGGIDR
jgi:hypothetical protein